MGMHQCCIHVHHNQLTMATASQINIGGRYYNSPVSLWLSYIHTWCPNCSHTNLHKWLYSHVQSCSIPLCFNNQMSIVFVVISLFLIGSYICFCITNLGYHSSHCSKYCAIVSLWSLNLTACIFDIGPLPTSKQHWVLKTTL